MDITREIKDAVNDVKIAENEKKDESTLTGDQVNKSDFVYKAQEGTKLVSFDVALKEFIGSTAKSMSSARMATDLAIVHYFNTGDLSYCQRFLDAIPKNYVRRTAYLAWLNTYCPVTLNGDRLYKDKRNEAEVHFGSTAEHPMTEEFLGLALNKSFWDHKPEPVVTDLEEADVIGNLLKGVNKLRGKGFNLSPEAVAKLGEAEQALVRLQ